MSMLFMDGFDHYGGVVDNMLSGAWASIGGSGTELGVPPYGARTGDFSYHNGPASGGARYILPATKTEVFTSLGFSMESLPQSNNTFQIVGFNDSSNNGIGSLVCESTGAISLYQGSTVLATTQGPVIVAGNWHFIEVDFNQGTGAVTVRVDDADATGTPAITATGLSLGSNHIAQMSFGGVNITAQEHSWIDDITVRDASGTINNSWLGDRRVATLLVDANGTAQGWTPRYYQKIGAGILNNTVFNNVTGLNNGVYVNQSTSLNIGPNDFTIETFGRVQAVPTGSNKAVIFGKWDEVNNQREYQLFWGSQSLNQGCLCWQTSTDGTGATVSQPIVFPWAPETDNWYNIAIVRAAGELLLFVDGVQQGLPIADSNTYFAGTAPFGLGLQMQKTGNPPITDNTFFQGWFDETRFTNGVGRYTSSYTPTSVAYPRGSSDTDWADVVLLMGYDTIIQDESSFTQTVSAINQAVQFTVSDGPAVGAWSAIGKAGPDDNTFVEAPFLPAVGILTLGAQPAVNDTVTVGTTDGTTAAVYTFVSSVSNAFDVLIDTSVANTLTNLMNAINAGTGAGTKYGTGTTSNFDVLASGLPAGQMMVTALLPGTGGNSIASTASLTHSGGWGASTLAGGTSIPGPSSFKTQRPPPDTTLISAIQIVARAYKSDAGLGSITTTFIGPLGGTTTDSTHNLTVNPVYYNDVYEIDPDTSGPISPTTVINGQIEIDRTA